MPSLKVDHNSPLYSSRITVNYLKYLKKYYPEVEIDPVLDYAGMTKYEVEDPGHWFSQNQVDRFHKILVEKTGNPYISREAGRFTLSSESLGAVKQYVLGLMKLSSIYLMVGKLSNSMTRGSTFKAKKLGANKAEIISIPKPGVAEKPYQCENRIGILESLPKLFSDSFAEVKHSLCFHKGGACCRYIVMWPKTPSLTWMRIRRYSLIIGSLISLISYFFISPQSWINLVLACIFPYLIISLISERVEKKEFRNTVETQGNAAKALLEEMNTRHSNALLVQDVGQTISGILNVEKILEAVLKIIKKHSNFDSGTILLANEDKTKLQYAAEFGHNRNQKESLRKIELSFNKADANEFLVKCFKEQKPFLANDMEEIKKNVSPESLKSIKQIDIESFICLPIVFKNESFGILAVERLNSKLQLTQSDISLLMGVASHIATSIMNAISFKKIKDNEERYRLLADNVTDVIWILDVASLQFSYVSPSVQRLQGYSPEELKKLPLSDVLPPASFKLATDAISEELIEAQTPHAEPFRSRTLELEGYCKDGSTVWFEVTASFLRNNSNEIISVLGISRDISERIQAEKERKKLEKQLQRAQKMEAIGTLAGGVAHDLNNILSGILSYPELLLMDLPSGSPLVKPLETIQDSGRKAAAIVQDLLTLARRGVAVSEVLNINDIITEYLTSPEFEKLKTFHPLADINTDFESDISNMLGSSVHLSKTIMNLVSNAAEAMPAGGTLTISTENQYIDCPVKGYDAVQKGDYVVLKVCDTGIGISSEEIGQIFEPFYTKKVMGRSGTGLGMAVVWGTVKDHKGYINVESIQGAGTTFTLYFPVTRKKIDKTKVNFSIKDYQGNGESILVIDDVKEQREIASTILSQLGYAVSTAACGEAAVDHMKHNVTDLLVLDMIMDPGIDGLETYKQILKLHPHQKAVIASGFSETDRVKEAQKLGAGKYIKKPYTIKNIGLAIKAALDGDVAEI
jgi:PAS domain S-box-containing protein